MKFSFPVKADEYWNLAGKLAARFGAPRALEELVIYAKNPDGLRVTVNRETMKVSWEIDDDPDGFQRRRKGITLSTDNLKGKLEFALGDPLRECDISSTSLLVFDQAVSKSQITLREQTLIGPLLSIDHDPAFISKEDAFSEIEEFRPLLLDDLVERVQSLDRAPSKCFIKVGNTLNLDERVYDFCRRNGISNPIGRPYSYEKVQAAKSNDYSSRQKLFEAVTNHSFLSTEPVPPAREQYDLGISIIIPNYNSAETLDTVFAGISGQQLPENLWEKIEVIIVDDGSRKKVEPESHWKEYRFRIKLVTLHSNSGVSHAREIGLKHASEEIIIFMDSDIILSSHYLHEHYIRNSILDDCIFVSFKKNIDRASALQSGKASLSWTTPNYDKDLRVYKDVSTNSVGVYDVSHSYSVSILEDTNFFKDFHGSRVFGVYDLSSMITGHNFSGRRSTFEKIKPFTKKLRGWGMEDVYLGLRALAEGCFIVPVLACGVYHLDHPPRSGSEEAKQKEYQENTKLIGEVLKSPATRLF